MCVENATIGSLQLALAAGRTTAAALVSAYLARIETYDRSGVRLGAVREVNPDATTIAAALDSNKPARRRPLEGIPILVKDNIATADAQHTTAGSLALAGAQAKRDATVVELLRRAGAVILGKANLTEFANILAIDMPAGYSSLGGQVKNPYAPELDDKGVPIVLPGGSSSGSAVAVAAGLAAAAIGTETSGSLLSPATQNGVVTVKPTVGLVSRAGIIPIAHSQDTAGPLTRTVHDAAILLNVLAAADPMDPATETLQRPVDYTSVLDKDGLKGARIGIPSDPADPANDVYYGPLPPRAASVMRDAIAVLEAQGATIVRANIPTEGWIGGPGTEMAILNRNPESPTRYQPARRPIVFVYELKHDLNAYLRDWATGTAMRSLADIVAFNQGQCRSRAALWPGHLSRGRGHPRRPQRIGICLGAADGSASLARTRARRLYGPVPARRGAVPRHRRCRNRRQGRLPERPGPRRLCLGGARQGHARLPLRRDLHRTRLERAHPAASCLCLRASDPGTPPALRPPIARPGVRVVAD